MIPLDLSLIDRYCQRYPVREWRQDVAGEMAAALLCGAPTYRDAYNIAQREIYAAREREMGLDNELAYDPLPVPSLTPKMLHDDAQAVAALLDGLRDAPLPEHTPQWLANVAVSQAYLTEIGATEYAPVMEHLSDIDALTDADWRAVLNNLVERGVIRSRGVAGSLACELAEMPTLARALLCSYTGNELREAGYSDGMIGRARDRLMAHVYRDDQL